MQAGDLVVCKGFGPRGIVGDTGVIIRPYPSAHQRRWAVLIAGQICIVAEDGLGVISEV